jgi:hypothetical protein
MSARRDDSSRLENGGSRTEAAEEVFVTLDPQQQ